MLTADQRDRKSRLLRQRAEIDAEIAQIMAGARKPDRLKAAAERRDRDKGLTGQFGQRAAHNRDEAYLSWLHQGLPCIACEIEGKPDPAQLRGTPNPVEAAHQWIVRGPMGQPPHTESIGRSPWAGDDQGIDAGSDRRFDGDHAGDGTSRNPTQDRRGSRLPGRRAGATAEPEQQARRDALDAAGERHEGGRPRGHRTDGDGSPPASESDDAHAAQERPERQPWSPREQWQGEIAERPNLPAGHEVELCQADRLAAIEHRPDWSLDDLARHIRLDDGLPAWVAEQRIAVGGPRGTSAASLIVEAFGDSVCPQIPEAIGRAILRTEAALAAIYDRARAA
jgi:DNA (cytosine-5)-methyltransferase 1